MTTEIFNKIVEKRAIKAEEQSMHEFIYFIRENKFAKNFTVINQHNKKINLIEFIFNDRKTHENSLKEIREYFINSEIELLFSKMDVLQEYFNEQNLNDK